MSAVKRFFKIPIIVSIISAIVFAIFLQLNNDVLEKYKIQFVDRILSVIVVATFVFLFVSWVYYSFKKFIFFIRQ